MEKIYSCVSQIKLTQHLFNAIESNFYARVISRQIIIRIKDFINLSRRYNNANITNNILKSELKRKLNELDNKFKNSLQLQRDKLSAHIQDLDFFELTNSWSNITKEEIDYFSNEVFDIYYLFNIQTDFQELVDIHFQLSEENIKIIKAIVQEKDIESTPHIGMDIFSLTRSNTSSIIPCHPIQDKILALNSINLMLNFEISLFNSLEGYEYKQVIKTLIVNDVVSFIDNLITREGSSYTGLDEIIDLQIKPWKRHVFFEEKPNTFFSLKKKEYDFREDKQIIESQEILNNFLDRFNLESLNSIRVVRNKISSHIDNDKSIENLIVLLDNLDFENLSTLYNDFYNLFLKVCKPTNYLNSFTMPTTKIRGITNISPQPEKMFFDNLDIKTEFESDDINDVEIYRMYINALLENLKNEEDIVSYFRNALTHSTIIETIEFEEKKIEINICQKYLIRRLKEIISIEEKRAILFLISKSGGWKTNITYILVETYALNFRNLNYEYLVYFGETVTEDSHSVFNILVKNLHRTNDFNVIYYTLLSLLSIHTKIDSFAILNNKKNATENKYSEVIKKEISTLDSFFQLIVSVLLTSEMIFTSKFAIYRKYYQELYLDFFQQTFFKSIKLLKFSKKFQLKKRLSPKDIKELKSNYQNNYLTKIFINISEKFNSKNSKFLYGIMVESLKLNFDFLPFIEHYAYANYKIGNTNKAVEVYEDLVRKNPDEVAYRIEILNYYFEQKNFRAIEKNIKYIESTYILNQNEQKKIEQIKRKI